MMKKLMLLMAALAAVGVCRGGDAFKFQEIGFQYRDASGEVGDPDVIRLKNKYVMYYSLGAGGTIGVAESADLTNWKKVKELNLGGCARKPSALLLKGVVHLFWEGTTGICHATSKDGLAFTPDATNPVFVPKLPSAKPVALDPEVWELNGDVLMMVATRYVKNEREQFFVEARAKGTSPLGRGDFVEMWPKQKTMTPNWQNWERACLTSPSVIEVGGVYYMFYCGGEKTRQVGVARGFNGVSLKRAQKEPLLEARSVEAFTGKDGVVRLFYQGKDEKGAYIGGKVVTVPDYYVIDGNNKDWVRLDYKKDVIPGSALDFSGMGFCEGPAGKWGWLKNVKGRFEFEGRPGVRQKFYGVNLVSTANFLDLDVVTNFIDRIVRLGYNSVRFHHHDGGLMSVVGDKVTKDERSFEKMDLMVAYGKSRGVYFTTDLYVSRRMRWEDFPELGKSGRMDINDFKGLMTIYEPAYRNWERYSKVFMEHRNKFTGVRNVDEAAMPLIALVNEGTLSRCFESFKDEPFFRKAYADWLQTRLRADPDFMKAGMLRPEELDTVDYWRNRKWSNIFAHFIADKERELTTRQVKFLRGLGSRALFTSVNTGGDTAPMQQVRRDCFDYVDTHFYADHPHFLNRKWQRPSELPNKNPAIQKELQPTWGCFLRLEGMPFCVTEWNFSGPGMYRGVGGMLTGAMSALQDWDGLWRFAYAHRKEFLRDEYGTPHYFDLAIDPLSQASDRAAILFFLRGDMAALEKRRVTVASEEVVANNGTNTYVKLVPPRRNVAWEKRVSMVMGSDEGTLVRKGDDVVRLPYAETVGEDLQKVENPHVMRDVKKGTLAFVTGRTLGGFATEGKFTAGGLEAEVRGAPATLWVSSLGKEDVRCAKRLLLTYLTDVQGDGATFLNEKRRILFKWGDEEQPKKAPLVRVGEADVRLTLDDPKGYRVWALRTDGARQAEIPCVYGKNELTFTVKVKGEHGAQILFEIVGD